MAVHGSTVAKLIRRAVVLTQWPWRTLHLLSASLWHWTGRRRRLSWNGPNRELGEPLLRNRDGPCRRVRKGAAMSTMRLIDLDTQRAILSLPTLTTSGVVHVSQAFPAHWASSVADWIETHPRAAMGEAAGPKRRSISNHRVPDSVGAISWVAAPSRETTQRICGADTVAGRGSGGICQRTLQFLRLPRYRP